MTLRSSSLRRALCALGVFHPSGGPGPDLSVTERLRMDRPRTGIAPAAALLCITLCACQTTGDLTPRVETKTVLVPTPIACKPTLPAEPSYPDTDAALKAAPDLFVKVQLMVAGRLLRIARLQVVNAALRGCEG